MFQRAKIVLPDFEESSRGRLIWICVQPPLLCKMPTLDGLNDHMPDPDDIVEGEWYITHLRVPGQEHPVYIDKICVEFLPEFVEEVDPEFI